MFQSKRKPQTRLGSALSMAEVIYHSTVRSVRAQHGNAFIAIAMNILQTILLVGVFYVMFSVLGLRALAIRGDFLIYLLTGIFMYITHIKAVSSVMGAEGPASPMMQHAPMNTIVALISGALGALYIQVLSLVIVLSVYHVAFTPVHLEEPVEAFGMFLLAWATGCSFGVVFLALKPWAPTFIGLVAMIYQRANMIASGKMFLANTLPSTMLVMFDWNPLFHIIDQARGFSFINYNPRYSNWEYAFWVGLVFLMIGLMGEFYTRRRASMSWDARR